MMTAVEALRSERAQLSEDERRWYATAWEELGENTRKTMTAAGPSSLDIPAHRMSPSVARLICTALLKLGWNAGAQLLSVPSPTIRKRLSASVSRSAMS